MSPISVPSLSGGTPTLRWAPVGPKTSRPSKTSLTLGGSMSLLMISQIASTPRRSAAGAMRPLSGPTNHAPRVSTIMGFLVLPTPGSTTPTCTVPSGK